MVEIVPIVTGPFEANSYLALERESGKLAVIDPGDDAENLISYIENTNLALAGILLTHGHLDHIGAVEALRLWSGAPVLAHGADQFIIAGFPDACRMFGLPVKPAPRVDYWLENDSDQKSGSLPVDVLGGTQLVVHYTPGHSPGGVCYQLDDYLITGDTLFKGSVGRTDLPGGDWQILSNSLVYLTKLPADLRVYPGHGPETSIGIECVTNPFLRDLE
jgi:glyoxylase-like metal-dependent hydrolase (beta-lactamase superfamily II)